MEALYHLRDVTFAEDAAQVRMARPQAMASLRNLAIGILHVHDHRNIAAAPRPDSCPPEASQAREQTLRHFAEALLQRTW